MSLLKSAAALSLLVSLASQSAYGNESLTATWNIESGDHIVIVGNEFADSLRQHGYWETFLHTNYPQHQLVVRNMGWGGDTVSEQLRPSAFGDVHTHLTNQEADTIILCFGMMESYRGSDKVDLFREQLVRMIDSFQSRQYNGHSAPNIVLISPIAHENVGGLYPSGEAHNEVLAQYAEAIACVAKEKELPYVDLFSSTAAWYRQSDAPLLTTDGIHLHAIGYRVVSQMMAQQLGLLPAEAEIAADLELSEGAEQVRQAIVKKNFQFYMRWRAANGEYIYGRRRGQWNMAPELQQQDEIVQQAQQAIWDLPPIDVDSLWAR